MTAAARTIWLREPYVESETSACKSCSRKKSLAAVEDFRFKHRMPVCRARDFAARVEYSIMKHRQPRFFGALGLVALMSFWAFAHLQSRDAALQQPAAVPSMELRRKLTGSDTAPLYVIEWVMPDAYRKKFRLWLADT